MRLKIGVISRLDVEDIQSFSGIAYFFTKAIKKLYGEVAHIFPRLNFFEELFITLVERCCKALTKKNIQLQRTTVVSKLYAKKIKAILKNKKCDFLIAFQGSIEIAYLDDIRIPIIYTSDTTFDLAYGYHPKISNFAAWNVTQAETIEKRAIENASLCIYSSEWAANSAITHYGKRPSLVKIIPFGANLESPPSREEIIENIHRKNLSKYKLLVVGKVLYETKLSGMEEFLYYAKQNMLDMSISIVGFNKLPFNFKDESLKIVPYLDKSVPKDYKKLYDLYMDANIFLHPTKSDATPIVLCEAMAFGLPIITADTGGVGSLVKNNVNGILLDKNASPKDYVSAVENLLSDKQNYMQMALTCRNLYDEKYNWDSFGNTFDAMIKERAWENHD